MIIILCLGSCGTPVEDIPKETIYSTNGSFALQGDRIFLSYGDGIYSMNTDGGDKHKLTERWPSWFMVSGDHIYYKVFSGALYSINTDGTDNKKLDDNEIIIDGNEKVELSDNKPNRMPVSDGWIYYIEGNEWKIYKMKTDGSERQLLSDDHINWFAVCGDLIYYTMTGSKIYTMNTNGGDRRLLVDMDSDNPYHDITYEVCARLHEDMPEYRFIATGMMRGADEWKMGFVMGLEVFDENGFSILSADFTESFYDEVIGSPVYNEMMDTMGLHVVDVNFDGYKDVIVLNNFAGAHGNTWYYCWLWDAKTSSFVSSESFAEICNPALDPVKKCIYSTGGSGAAYWGGSIYKFIDGKFVVTNDLDTNWDGLVETKLVNGKMEIVRKVSYDEGDREKIIDEEQEYYKNNELWKLDHPRWYWVGGHHADQWLE